MIKDDESSHQNKKKKSKMKATKDFNLISFGDEAEEEENDLEVVQKSYKNKSKSSHDLLNDPKLLAEVGDGKEINKNEEKGSDDDYEPDSKRSKGNEHVDLSNIRSKLQKTKSSKTKVEYKSNVPENEYEDTSKENDEEFDAQKRKR